MAVQIRSGPNPSAPSSMPAKHFKRLAVGEPGDRRSDLRFRRGKPAGDLLRDVVEVGCRFHGRSVDAGEARARPVTGLELASADCYGVRATPKRRRQGPALPRPARTIPHCKAGGSCAVWQMRIRLDRSRLEPRISAVPRTVTARPQAASPRSAWRVRPSRGQRQGRRPDRLRGLRALRVGRLLPIRPTSGRSADPGSRVGRSQMAERGR